MARNPFDALQQSLQGAELPSRWGASADDAGLSTPLRAHIGHIPAAEWQPHERSPDTRKRPKARFLQLIARNKRQIERVAEEVGVPEHEVIRYLLEYGLRQIGEGELALEPTLERRGMTLYPGRVVVRPRRRREKRIHTTCRGIPDETWEMIRAHSRGFPLWQTVNRLIEHGLEQVKNGRLQLKPERVHAYTLYP